MKEIGSEFWTGCTPLDGSGITSLLPKDFKTRYTLCGRTGLEIAVSDILAVENRSLKVYMPSYCCHTMIEPFTSHSIAVEFYNVALDANGIKKDFDEANDCDIVFLMDYFGYIDPNTIELCNNQKAQHKIVIYDATHSVFCTGMKYDSYDYVFASLRKWIGVNAGFCSKKKEWKHNPVLTQNTDYTSLRNRCFDLKSRFISGEQVDKQEFLECFGKAEENLETRYRNYAPDPYSLETINHINVDYLKSKRRENANIIISAFSKSSGIVKSMPSALSEQDCPLFVPLDVHPEIRADLRKHLVQNTCYLPVHWPLSDLHKVNETSAYMYEHELSCICDQRYDMEDISRLIAEIKKFND